MEVPIILENEPLPVYLNRLAEYKQSLMQNKYTLLLEFINMWLVKEYKSLTDFKNILESELLKDEKHNRKVLRLYSKKLTQTFVVKFSVEDDTDSDDITDKYIIYVLTRLLCAIGYTLVSKKLNDKCYYTIRQK